MSRIMSPGKSRSGLQSLATAMGLARSAFGIAQDIGASGRASDARSLAAAETERKAQGILTPGEKQALVLGGKAEEVPEGTKGAISVGIRVPGSQEQQTAFLRPPQKQPQGGLTIKDTTEGLVGITKTGEIKPLGIRAPKKGSTQAQIARQEERVFRREDRRQDQLDKKVDRFAQNLRATDIPKMTGAAERVAELLPPPGSGKDIPGVGPFEGSMPDFIVGDEGRELRQAASKMFNIELKDRSGAAVTNNELKRLKREFGTGRFSTEAQFRKGIVDYAKALKTATRNSLAGAPPEAIEEYMKRGGRDFMDALDKTIEHLEKMKK